MGRGFVRLALEITNFIAIHCNFIGNIAMPEYSIANVAMC